MAYFSGNAFSIINTRKVETDFVDYMQFCGAGIEISSNNFTNNIGLKRHNGGAGVISCYNIEDTINSYYANRGFTSGHYIQRRHNLTDEEQLELDNATNEILYYYDPKTNMTNITDLVFPNTTNYTMLQYATVIRNNTFNENFSGMKGSALLLQGLSEL